MVVREAIENYLNNAIQKMDMKAAGAIKRAGEGKLAWQVIQMLFIMLLLRNLMRTFTYAKPAKYQK
ncbi:hypothetical protein SAMN05216516_102491 [Izhakiella capsodis]|uniref:Uncharacterized protein n=1 Tax=Izhakiella capsodis TaxID=1367852 RepID=A0A1I4WHQ3_9GAMM|nr:hypothetical protein SAMN05216516_102491 [Izhakiella capsodis]